MTNDQTTSPRGRGRPGKGGVHRLLRLTAENEAWLRSQGGVEPLTGAARTLTDAMNALVELARYRELNLTEEVTLMRAEQQEIARANTSAAPA